MCSSCSLAESELKVALQARAHEAPTRPKLHTSCAKLLSANHILWPRGVTVSTLDSESSDRRSNTREAFHCSLRTYSPALLPATGGARVHETWEAMLQSLVQVSIAQWQSVGLVN